MRNSFLCWFLLTLDHSIQHNFATLSEVAGNPLILSISENGSSHINKKNFLLKIDHVVYQIYGNLALIQNNNRTWVIKSVVYFSFYSSYFTLLAYPPLFDLLLTFSVYYIQRIVYAYSMSLFYVYASTYFLWPRRIV